MMRKKEEPETLETAIENYQIPVLLGYYNERWVYGKEAKKLLVVREGEVVTDLYQKAMRREKIHIGEKDP